MDIDDRFRNKIMNDIMIKLRTKDYVLSAEEFIEAADEIERLRGMLKCYTCECEKDDCCKLIVACGQIARNALKEQK